MKSFGVVGALALCLAGCGGAAGHADLGDPGTAILGFAATPSPDDPATCADAATTLSYAGCSFWPTAVANGVLPVFDFAVLVANGNRDDAEVTITGPGTAQTMVLPGGTMQKIYLPWVDALTPAGATCTTTPQLDGSRLGKQAAFHLVSSRPIIAYQWNPLQYRATNLHKADADAQCVASCGALDKCFAASNDASLLLPDTALSGRYRVAAHARGASNYVAITATRDETLVTVTLGRRAYLLAGPLESDFFEVGPGEVQAFLLDAGDVAELVGDPDSDYRVDLSGTRIDATQPVQVVAGDICLRAPDRYPYSCNHVEETQLPLETWGRQYVVTGVSGPANEVVPHVVRLVGHTDGTTLQFEPPIEGAPSVLDAGDVVSLGAIHGSFVVTGSAPFAVATFQLSASFIDASAQPDTQRGDPAQSVAIPVEQMRTQQIVLAPDDFEQGWLDLAMPTGTTVTLDGAPLPIAPSPIGTSGFAVAHVPLPKSAASAHTLIADRPIGAQVVGYGLFTSYQVPGGLNLKRLP